jgi:hypothetical protein
LDAGYQFVPSILNGHFGQSNACAILIFGLSLGELVKSGVNGLIFKDAAELAQQFEVGDDVSVSNVISHYL